MSFAKKHYHNLPNLISPKEIAALGQKEFRKDTLKVLKKIDRNLDNIDYENLEDRIELQSNLGGDILGEDEDRQSKVESDIEQLQEGIRWMKQLIELCNAIHHKRALTWYPPRDEHGDILSNATSSLLEIRNFNYLLHTAVDPEAIRTHEHTNHYGNPIIFDTSKLPPQKHVTVNHLIENYSVGEVADLDTKKILKSRAKLLHLCNELEPYLDTDRIPLDTIKELLNTPQFNIPQNIRARGGRS